MRKLIPIKDSVVCKRITEKANIIKNNGVFSKITNVDLYEIIDIHCSNDKTFNFAIGDIVMSNSTGDEIEINESEVVYLFKNENIMCKIED